MPYTNPVHEGNQWCIYHKNPDGSRGKKAGCSDTEDGAKAYLARLHMAMAGESAKEKSMEEMMLSQEETAYTTVSPKTGEQQCANCRWFEWSNYMTDSDGKAKMGTSSCHLVEGYPAPILPTGYCDRWEAVPAPQPDTTTPVSVVIVEPEEMVMEFTPGDGNALTRAVRGLTGKPAPGYTLTKDADGRRLMVIVTSSGYRDREFEHVAEKALAEYVESQWKGAGASLTFQGDNVHLFWHMKQLGAIGDIVWAGMIAGFLVEVAKERDHLIARKVWDFIEAHPELDWGASHGFKVRALNGDTYTAIRKFETSSLPRAFAAHPLTYSGVFKMVDITKKDPKDALLDEMFHIEGVAEFIATQGLAKLAEKLAAAGVSAKELNKTKEGEAQAEPPAADPQEGIDFSALVAQLITSQRTVLEQLQALGAQVTGEAQARAALETELKAQLAAIAADNEKVKAQLALAPRSVTRDIAQLTAVPDKEAVDLRKNLPQEGSDFWLGAVPPEKH